MLAGQNGILTQSKEAKEQTEIGKEKEIVVLAATDSRMNNSQNMLEEVEFQTTIDNYAKGEAEISQAGKEFIVYFINTNRFYTVDENGNVELANDIEVVKDPYPGDYTKNENGEELYGTSDSPYEINCVEDLIELSNQSLNGEKFDGKYIQLNKTVNIESSLSYSDYNNTELFGDYNGDGVTESIKNELTNKDGCGFKPIRSFAGTFIGNGNKIKNLYMSTSNASNSKFAFIKENTGNIDELELSGSINYKVQQLTSTFNCIGGFVGLNEGNIRNSKNDIDININVTSGAKTVYGGGIAGGTDGGVTIENCQNTGNINIITPTESIDIRVGGITGRLDGASTVNNCINASETIHIETLGYLFIGGIASDVYNNSIITNCSNSSKIEGITGTNSSKARIYMGGIISSTNYSNDMEVKSCFNTGILYASGYAPKIGGILGDGIVKVIKNCYNTGSIETSAISLNASVGGIIGNCGGTIQIENAYNVGSFILEGQTTFKGAIYGNGLSGGTVKNCYYIKQEGLEIGGNINNIQAINSSEKTAEQMKLDEIIESLNKDGGEFKKDINNINKGYPILNRQ